MDAFVYIIGAETPKGWKTYVGWTNDLEKRLSELEKFKAERERYDHLMSSKKEIDLILSEGAEKAMKTANEVMNRVRKKLGY